MPNITYESKVSSLKIRYLLESYYSLKCVKFLEKFRVCYDFAKIKCEGFFRVFLDKKWTKHQEASSKSVS